MTNTVTHINNFVDRSLIQKLFVKFANKYGNLWTSRLGEHGNWQHCEDDWYEELNTFTVKDVVCAVKQALIIYKDYPPTQGQLVALCYKASGVPCEDDVINLMVNRDFNHPLVKMIYDRIGSWVLTNGKTEEIRSKTKAVYAECLRNFRDHPDKAWERLNTSNKQLKLASPELPKIASQQERRTFNERMAECLKRAEESKRLLGDLKHPEFANKEEDKEVWATYKKYLLDLPEELVITLPIAQAYDRNRFLAAIDTARYLEEVGYDPNVAGQKENVFKGFNGPQKIYKHWMADL